MAAKNRRVADEEIIEVFRKSDERFLTATEVADEIGVTRQAMNSRLKRLREQGILASKRAGSRAVGYWLVDS